MWKPSGRNVRVLLPCAVAIAAAGCALLACTSKSSSPSSPAVTCQPLAPEGGPLPDCYPCQAQVCADAGSAFATACSTYLSCACACGTDSGATECRSGCAASMSSDCTNAGIQLDTCNLVIGDPTGPCATACGIEETTGACTSLQVCCVDADAAAQTDCYSIVASGNQSACAAALDAGLVGSCY